MQLWRRQLCASYLCASWHVREFDIYLLAELYVLGFCKHYVCVCVHVCAYIYIIYIHTYLPHTYTHTHTHTMEGGEPKFGFSIILLSETLQEEGKVLGMFPFYFSIPVLVNFFWHKNMFLQYLNKHVKMFQCTLVSWRGWRQEEESCTLLFLSLGWRSPQPCRCGYCKNTAPGGPG